MNNNPLFSVITVCKNNLYNLKKTHESIKTQTSPDLEWIVVDGHSTDGTVEFLSGLSDGDIQWGSVPDQGLYDAMNKGLGTARGEFVLFLNAGDCFATDQTLKILTEKLKEIPDADMVYGDAVIVYQNGKEFFEKARSTSYFRYGQPTYHQAILFKRQSIGPTRFHPEKFRIAADYAFALELISTGARVFQLPFPVCKFYLGGISSKNTAEILKETWVAQRDILNVSLWIRVLSYFVHLFAMVSKERIPWLYRGAHRIYQRIHPA